MTNRKAPKRSCGPLRRAIIEEAKGWAVVVAVLVIFFATRGVF